MLLRGSVSRKGVPSFKKVISQALCNEMFMPAFSHRGEGGSWARCRPAPIDLSKFWGGGGSVGSQVLCPRPKKVGSQRPAQVGRGDAGTLGRGRRAYRGRPGLIAKEARALPQSTQNPIASCQGGTWRVAGNAGQGGGGGGGAVVRVPATRRQWGEAGHSVPAACAGPVLQWCSPVAHR